jgi:hypothetical protein
MLKLSQMLDTRKSRLVVSELDEYENLDHFALKGVASDDAIDEYLSNYEMLNVAYENNLISDDMAQDAFSWELEKAVNDKTTRRYIAVSKAEVGDLSTVCLISRARSTSTSRRFCLPDHGARALSNAEGSHRSPSRRACGSWCARPLVSPIQL